MRGEPGVTQRAGSTTQLDLQLKDWVVAPTRLVDLGRLPFRQLTATSDRIGGPHRRAGPHLRLNDSLLDDAASGGSRELHERAAAWFSREEALPAAHR